MTKRIYDIRVVAGRLRELRREAGLSMEELANQLHWSESTIKQYECGGKSGRIPAEHNLSLLAEFFKVEPGYILGTQNYRTKLERWFSQMPPDKLTDSAKEIRFFDAMTDYFKEKHGLNLEEYPVEETAVFFHALDDSLATLAKEFKEWVGE